MKAKCLTIEEKKRKEKKKVRTLAIKPASDSSSLDAIVIPKARHIYEQYTMLK